MYVTVVARSFRRRQYIAFLSPFPLPNGKISWPDFMGEISWEDYRCRAPPHGGDVFPDPHLVRSSSQSPM
jgi:hypothetical protein